MKPGLKWTLIILAILIVIAIIIGLAVASKKKNPNPINPGNHPGNPNQGNTSIWGSLGAFGVDLLNASNLLNPCDKDKPGGYRKDGTQDNKCISVYCDKHPEDSASCNSSTDCFNGCSSSHPGYNCTDFVNKDPNC